METNLKKTLRLAITPAEAEVIYGIPKGLWLICGGRGQAPNFTKPGLERCFTRQRILKPGFLETRSRLKTPRWGNEQPSPLAL